MSTPCHFCENGYRTIHINGIKATFNCLYCKSSTTMKPEPQMSELPAEKQAAKAIAHTLRNISDRPGVAWYLGHGTQTYALLTEAHATLHGLTMEEVQENWPPADQPSYDGDSLNQCPFCGSHYLEVKNADDEAFVECGDCQAKGPFIDMFDCDDSKILTDAARRKWNERTMPR